MTKTLPTMRAIAQRGRDEDPHAFRSTVSRTPNWGLNFQVLMPFFFLRAETLEMGERARDGDPIEYPTGQRMQCVHQYV